MLQLNAPHASLLKIVTMLTRSYDLKTRIARSHGVRHVGHTGTSRSMSDSAHSAQTHWCRACRSCSALCWRWQRRSRQGGRLSATPETACILTLC